MTLRERLRRAWRAFLGHGPDYELGVWDSELNEYALLRLASDLEHEQRTEHFETPLRHGLTIVVRNR